MVLYMGSLYVVVHHVFYRVYYPTHTVSCHCLNSFSQNMISHYQSYIYPFSDAGFIQQVRIKYVLYIKFCVITMVKNRQLSGDYYPRTPLGKHHYSLYYTPPTVTTATSIPQVAAGENGSTQVFLHCGPVIWSVSKISSKTLFSSDVRNKPVHNAVFNLYYNSHIVTFLINLG